MKAPEIVTYAYFMIGACGTKGSSESAKYVASQISLIQFKQPEFYFSVMKRVLPDLNDVRKSYSSEGWDGYGAKPVLEATYHRALEFLQTLPDTMSTPAVDAESDGYITLEWYQSPARTLTVSITPTGELYYAALIGPNRRFGKEYFFGEPSKDIIELAARVEGE